MRSGAEHGRRGLAGGRSRTAALLRVLAVALALWPAGGCTIVHQSSGGPVPDARATLTVGVSSKAQALAALGPPFSVRRQFDGDLLLWRRDDSRSRRLLLVPFIPIYEHSEGHAETDELALLFDRAGVLSGIGERRDIR